MRFRQLPLRRMDKVSTEWALFCAACNVKRLWALRPGEMSCRRGVSVIPDGKVQPKRPGLRFEARVSNRSL